VEATVYVEEGLRRRLRGYVKTNFYLILVLVLIVLFSIPMLAIVVFIKLMSKGPAILDRSRWQEIMLFF